MGLRRKKKIFREVRKGSGRERIRERGTGHGARGTLRMRMEQVASPSWRTAAGIPRSQDVAIDGEVAEGSKPVFLSANGSTAVW